MSIESPYLKKIDGFPETFPPDRPIHPVQTTSFQTDDQPTTQKIHLTQDSYYTLSVDTQRQTLFPSFSSDTYQIINPNSFLVSNINTEIITQYFPSIVITPDDYNKEVISSRSLSKAFFGIDINQDALELIGNQGIRPQELFEEELSFLSIIGSTPEAEYVLIGEEASKFQQNLDNPNPERVELRKKTLKRALNLFEKYNQNI